MDREPPDNTEAAREYARILRQFVQHEDEGSLFAAADLGRRLVAECMPPEEVVELHQLAIEVLGGEFPALTLNASAALVSPPLYEMLMAHGIAFREQMAARERRQRANLEAVIEQSDDLIMITDRQGHLEYVNRAFLDTTGYSRDEALGSTPGELIGTGVAGTDVYRNLWQTILRGDTWTGKLVDRKKNGEHFVVDSAIFPIRDMSGSGVQLVCISRNITERSELERRNQEKKQKLESIGLLAAGLAHDLNNMLGMVLGYADLLEPQIADDQGRRNIAQIRTAALRGRDLVAQTMAFTRSDSETERKPVLVADVVAEVAALLEVRTNPQVEISWQDDSNAALVRGHANQIFQVVMNLGTNAIQAMDTLSGSLRFEIATEKPHARGVSAHEYGAAGDVVLRVKDTGHGLSEAQIEHIFDPFYSTRQDSGGTGLGLAVVRTIVERNGGQIQVVSSPGEGTEFIIHLPRYLTPDDDDMPHEQLPTIASGKASGKSVLIVDDDQEQLDLLTSQLRRKGLEVIAVADPWDALRTFHAADGAVGSVVTDYEMPGMNGLELSSRIKGLRPDTTVVLCTGNKAAIAEIDPAKYQIKKIFAKPIDSAELANLLIREAAEPACG